MKLIEKLLKLISHEKSAREIGSTAEAEAFAERIQILLDTHNLSMSDVEIHEAKNSPVDLELVQEEITEIKNWQRILLANICEINGCYSLEHRLGVQCVIGRPADRQIVVSLFRYFEQLGREQAEKLNISSQPALIESRHWWLHISEFSPNEEEIDSFLLGFAASVSKRLKEISEKDRTDSQNSAALVFLGNRQDDNKKFIEEKLNVESAEIDTSGEDREAFRRGARAGERVALTDKTLEEK